MISLWVFFKERMLKLSFQLNKRFEAIVNTPSMDKLYVFLYSTEHLPSSQWPVINGNLSPDSSSDPWPQQKLPQSFPSSASLPTLQHGKRRQSGGEARCVAD